MAEMSGIRQTCATSKTNPAAVAVALAVSLTVYIVSQNCWLALNDIGDDFVRHLPVLFQLFNIAMQLVLHRQGQYFWECFHSLHVTGGTAQGSSICSSAHRQLLGTMHHKLLVP